MKNNFKLIVIFLSLIINNFAYAKAYFASIHEIIDKSDLIAIGEVKEIQNGKFNLSNDPWTYEQKITFQVSEKLKGSSAQSIIIYAKQNFICGTTLYDYGKYVLFLVKEDNHYLNSGWQPSVLRVSDNNVEWFKKSDSRFPSIKKELDLVKDEITGMAATKFYKNSFLLNELVDN